MSFNIRNTLIIFAHLIIISVLIFYGTITITNKNREISRQSENISSLMDEKAKLNEEKESLFREKTLLLEEKTKIQLEIKDLTASKEILTKEKESLVADNQKLERGLTNLNNSLALLKSSNTELQNKYDQVKQTLDQIYKVYPLKNFKSVSELETWAYANTTTYNFYTISYPEEWQIGMRIAQKAIAEGYYVWVELFDKDEITLTCRCALVNGQEYAWVFHRDYYEVYNITNYYIDLVSG